MIEGGRVVERGTHDGLLAAGGRYAALYRTQFAAGVDSGDDALVVPHEAAEAPCLVPGCDLEQLRVPVGMRDPVRR